LLMPVRVTKGEKVVFHNDENRDFFHLSNQCFNVETTRSPYCFARSGVRNLYVFVSPRWSRKASLMYSDVSMHAGPMFLSH
jgi:hypothetical protein